MKFFGLLMIATVAGTLAIGCGGSGMKVQKTGKKTESDAKTEPEDKPKVDVFAEITKEPKAENIDALIKYLGDPLQVRRDKAATALGTLRFAAVPKLIDVLKQPSKNNTAKYHALMALADLGIDAYDAIEQLNKIVTEDTDYNMRIYAAYALGQIGNRAKVASLDILKNVRDTDQDSSVRREAAAAIAKIEKQ